MFFNQVVMYIFSFFGFVTDWNKHTQNLNGFITLILTASDTSCITCYFE